MEDKDAAKLHYYAAYKHAECEEFELAAHQAELAQLALAGDKSIYDDYAKFHNVNSVY